MQVNEFVRRQGGEGSGPTGLDLTNLAMDWSHEYGHAAGDRADRASILEDLAGPANRGGPAVPPNLADDLAWVAGCASGRREESTRKKTAAPDRVKDFLAAPS